MVPVKHEFELSRLEYKGKSYYVKGVAYGMYDKDTCKVTDMYMVVSQCMEMPVCQAPEGIEDLVAECLAEDVDVVWVPDEETE